MTDPRIISIPTLLPGRRNDLCLFRGSKRALLLDTGIRGSWTTIEAVLTGHGVTPASISHVVVSHCDVDHFGGLAELRQAIPRATVVAHPADAPLMSDFDEFLRGRGDPFAEAHGLSESAESIAWMRGVSAESPAETHVSGGEQIDLGDRTVEILHLPGHSLGHLAVWDPTASVLAISDAILGGAVPALDGSPLFPPTYRHVAAYRDTIRRVRELAPATLHTAHYGEFHRDQVTAFLDESDEFVDVTERLVIGAVNRGTSSLAELVDALLPEIGDWPREGRGLALAFPLCGHLEDLAQRHQLSLDLTASPARIGSHG